MRLNKILYTCAALAAVVSLSSCKDFLDTMPDTRVELTSVEKARMLLVDSYPAYNPTVVGELTSDNMEDNNTADSKGTRFNLKPYDRADDELFAFEQVMSNSSSDYPSGLWNGYYGSIAGANAALECLDKLQERVKAGETVEDANLIPAVRAEALMIRAYSNFMLANIFCMPYRGPELSKAEQGLPYPIKPETTVKPHYDRLNLAELYDRIQADIDEALPLIDNSIYTVPKYHFNQQAAYAFAARFYLWKRDYKKVLEYCNRAFGGEGANVEQYMSDIWANAGDFYYISDFGLYYLGTDKLRNFLITATYSQAWRHYVGGLRYAVNRDAKRSTIQGPGPTWDGFSFRNSQTGETFSMHPAFNGTCGLNGKSQYGSYFAGNACEQFEYTNKIAGIGYTHVTRGELTGEETLLMRAEAKLFLGDKAGAIADLAIWEKARRDCPGAVGHEDTFKELTEAVINRFYIDRDPGFGIAKPIHIDEVYPCDYALTADMMGVMQCIQHFRRIESVHTGMRFFDLKRLGIEWSHKIGPENRIETMTLFDPRRAIQIPNEVVAAGFEPNKRVDADDLVSGNVITYPAAQ